MNVNLPPFVNVKNVFKGENNYAIGILFLIGYLMTFFSKMKQCNVSKREAFFILFIISILCSFYY